MKTELLGFNTITFDIRKDTLSVTCGGSTFESDYNKITDKTEKELKKLLKTSTLKEVSVNAREWGKFYVNTRIEFKVSPRMLAQVNLVLSALGLPSEFRCDGKSYSLDAQEIVKKLKTDAICTLIPRDEVIRSSWSSNNVLRGFSMQ